jgi:hypothetical protein
MHSKGISAIFLASTMILMPLAAEAVIVQNPQNPARTTQVCTQSCMNKLGRGFEIALRAKADDERQKTAKKSESPVMTFTQMGIPGAERYLHKGTQTQPLQSTSTDIEVYIIP